MKINENSIDRLVRVGVGIVLFLTAFFWVGGVVQIVLFTLAVIAFCSSITGFCPLYTLLNISTVKHQVNLSLGAKIGTIIGFILLFGLGIAGSIFFSKKVFLEDFSGMNAVYKQLLFDTGKEKRAESIKDYEVLMPVFSDFVGKYSVYTPWCLKGDAQFVTDVTAIQQLLVDLKTLVFSGNLVEVHKELEKVRSVFQEILKRNDFSLITVALVDFHDVMEILIAAADEKDPQKILDIYPSANEKLSEVEKSLNTEAVQLIRSSLESLLQLAKEDKKNDLSAQAQILKANFIKVYLKN